ncbi:LacI family DNA-binding transcriptional regulator [Leucobacter viscericola]|uniref:LacI family DNA-binding transcriptional regulator n=1 Tax=Leucobacter viscericola TaxID=2714935 RepID=UPI001FCAECF0|nr:LacI family DNA-binding transcriptional regulator [Leucobacter viscericola]
MKRPTIYDVAERAGVSKSLVSLVLRDSPRSAPKSARRFSPRSPNSTTPRAASPRASRQPAPAVSEWSSTTSTTSGSLRRSRACVPRSPQRAHR